jgi:hypothetical protein
VSTLAELLSIYEKHGTVNPEIVLAEATPVDHPLHDRFEWDDSIAGHKYRLNQARELIRSVKVQPADDSTASLRAFVSVRAPSEPSNYVPVETVDNPVTQAIVLRQMRREIEALRRRYEHLAEFWAAIQELSA